MDNGTGDYDITWNTDFADTNYAVVGMCDDANNAFVAEDFANKAVGVTNIITRRTSTAAAQDIDSISVIAIGNQ